MGLMELQGPKLLSLIELDEYTQACSCNACSIEIDLRQPY